MREDIIINIISRNAITSDCIEMTVECDGQMYDIIMVWKNDQSKFYYADGKKPDYIDFEYQVMCAL